MYGLIAKPHALALAAAILLSGCGAEERAEETSSLEEREATVSVSDAAPVTAAVDSTYQDLEGNPLEIADFAGQKVFLNYWATWCAPCIREIPSINRAEAELADEGYVFLLASDESLDTIREFLADREFDGTFIKLNTYFAEQGVQAVPSTMLYDENGEIIQTWLGDHEWDTPEMLAEIRAAE